MRKIVYSLNPFDSRTTKRIQEAFTYGSFTHRNGNNYGTIVPKFDAESGIYALNLFVPDTKIKITNASRLGYNFRSPLVMEHIHDDKVSSRILKLINACNTDNIISFFKYNTNSHKWVSEPVENKVELGELLNIKDRKIRNEAIKTLEEYNIIREGKVCVIRDNKKINVSVFYLSPLIIYHGGLSVFLYEAFKDCISPYINAQDKTELDILYKIYKGEDVSYAFYNDDETKKIESAQTLSDKTYNFEIDVRNSSTQSFKDFETISLNGIISHSVKQVKSKNKKKFIVEDFPKEDIENLFYMTQPVIDNPGQKTHGKSIVKKYKYLPIDIDIKTEDGAIPDKNIDTLEKDKQYILDNLISLFPEPVSLTKTRNGWQMLYELSTPISDVDEWRKTLRDKVYSILKGIIDTNAGGAGSLFRYPGSIHHKEGTAPYTTVLYHASRKTYTVDSLLKAFQSEEIKKAVKDIIKTMPQYFKKTKKSKILPQNTPFSVKDTSDNIECMVLPNSLKLYNVNPKNYDYYKAISKMDINYFKEFNKDKPVVKLKFADAFDYISRQSIAEFLKLEKGNQSRRCIFHNDTDPSCIINDFDDKNNKQCISTYYCFNCTKGHAMDIFNIVSKFVFKEDNRNFSSVEKFLHIVYNIEII